MFTGLVEELGTVAQKRAVAEGARLIVRCARLAADARIGDSIAVNGCCLTAVEIGNAEMGFDLVPETLQRTNLGRLVVGDEVNLESSLRADGRIGGHLVTGHIDGCARMEQRDNGQSGCKMWFRIGPQIAPLVVGKGSIAVDGVSLTLVDVQGDRFSVALIPHTLQHTTLGQRQPGDTVNIETDLLSKYVQRQLQWAGILPDEMA